MKKLSRLTAMSLSAGILLVGGLALGAPAYALGSKTMACGDGRSVAGTSSASSAQTFQDSSGSCGQVKVRVGYYAPGGVSAYSSWSYGSKTVTQTSSQWGSIFAGNHGVTDPGLIYDKSKFFTT